MVGHRNRGEFQAFGQSKGGGESDANAGEAAGTRCTGDGAEIATLRLELFQQFLDGTEKPGAGLAEIESRMHKFVPALGGERDVVGGSVDSEEDGSVHAAVVDRFWIRGSYSRRRVQLASILAAFPRLGRGGVGDGVARDVSKTKPKDGLTPMLRHYMEVKSEHPDAILLYRMGDFYELFLMMELQQQMH